MEQTMGQKIAALRKKKNMTQAELADRLGITDKAVSKWERDLSCPDIALLPRLAEVFETTVDELMPGKKESASGRKDLSGLVHTILGAVPLAMGVAVAVLSALGKLEWQDGLSMLGIGMVCVGASLLNRNGK